MPLAALPALGAATLALAASAAPLSPVAAAGTAAGRQPRARAHGHGRDRPCRARSAAITARPGRRVPASSGTTPCRAAKRIGGPRGAVVRQAVTSTQRLAATGRPAGGPSRGRDRRGPRERRGRAVGSPAAGARRPRALRRRQHRLQLPAALRDAGPSARDDRQAQRARDDLHRRGRKRGWRCRRAALLAAADRLIEVSVPAGPTLRFEYLFGFGGGRPGWVSAMTQATGRPGARAHRGDQRRAPLRRRRPAPPTGRSPDPCRAAPP